MKDAGCVAFLQWALPQLQMRWLGFRKVRKQVCKRIDRRLQELDLPDVAAYRDYLAAHPTEWLTLDSFCRISISRFYRDWAVFDQIQKTVLPALAEMTLACGAGELRGWSIGCASGEEPYTLNLIWRLSLQVKFPDLSFGLLVTDVDDHLLHRARIGCYPASSVKDLSDVWLEQAFVNDGEHYCLRAEFRDGVAFRQQDIRTEQADGSFHLILCRNLVFTYFEAELQQSILVKIIDYLSEGGVLIIGNTESLPKNELPLQPWFPNLGIYRRQQ